MLLSKWPAPTLVTTRGSWTTDEQRCTDYLLSSASVWDVNLARCSWAPEFCTHHPLQDATLNTPNLQRQVCPRFGGLRCNWYLGKLSPSKPTGPSQPDPAPNTLVFPSYLGGAHRRTIGNLGWKTKIQSQVTPSISDVAHLRKWPLTLKSIFFGCRGWAVMRQAQVSHWVCPRCGQSTIKKGWRNCPLKLVERWLQLEGGGEVGNHSQV